MPVALSRRPPRLWLCCRLQAPTDGGEMRDVLSRLATWCGRFTPWVSIEGDEALLLEVRASLRYFSGLEALQEAVTAGLRAHGYPALTAVAPTARAALWLARAGGGVVVEALPALASALRGLPTACLAWPPAACSLLEGIGVATVGECVRLPRHGLARRLGPGCLHEVDEAMGRRPESRAAHQPAEAFSATLELPREGTDTALLCEGFRRLLLSLAIHLGRRQAGVCLLWCGYLREQGDPHWWRVGVRRHCADTRLLLDLIRLRVDRERPGWPVSAVALRSVPATGHVPAAPDLYTGEDGAGEPLDVLLGRLRARLGHDAVHGLCPVTDHRPERSWCAVVDPPASGAVPPWPLPAGPRPLWLLPTARRLPFIDGGLYCDGLRLVLEEGPERLETGWWDGADIRRDYYVASRRGGSRLWVYQELRSGRWYLHGVGP